jgi:hypothetical protein
MMVQLQNFTNASYIIVTFCETRQFLSQSDVCVSQHQRHPILETRTKTDRKTMPRKGNASSRVRKPAKTTVREGECDDTILAPNSDTEGEPLAKRQKRIERIADVYREGGEITLVSTSLRGPVVKNPWARRKKIDETPESVEIYEVARVKKRRKPAPIKDSKVDQYFPAQKNSQEKKVIQKKIEVKKYAAEVEDPIVESLGRDGRTRITQIATEGSPMPF